MDRTECSRVACIEELKQVERLTSPNFSELRGEYICSWCEVRDGQLFAIPHPNSKREIRRFTYPRDAEIVGLVTGVAMRLAPVQNR